MPASGYAGHRLRVTANSQHLEDDACGWDASGIHETLYETGCKTAHPCAEIKKEDSNFGI